MNEDFFNKNVCIVIQGPLNYQELIYKNYIDFNKNVIISTNDTPQLFLTDNFTIVQNEFAVIPGKANFNNQVKNTYNGIKKAKELGFEYVFKIRSDIFIDDIITLINTLDSDKIYFPAYHLYDGGYLCEHMLFGEINIMEELWDIPTSNSDLPPETQLTKHFDEMDCKKSIDFIFPILYNKKINAFWVKYQKYLNEYEFDKLFVYERK